MTKLKVTYTAVEIRGHKVTYITTVTHTRTLY